jgi:enoyl-CoA hydratase
VETLQIEHLGGVAVVRLDRPPANAINDAMRRELRLCFDELSQDRSIAAVVLGSTNERVFCAGKDLHERPAEVADARSVLDPLRLWREAQYAVHQCVVPVIAAVEGKALGGGFGLVGVCDLVIAGSEATFGLPEINVGTLGGASKALRLLGASAARRMLFFGEPLAASELYRLGGIEEVVEAGSAEHRAVEMAQLLVEKSPTALRLAKESILRMEDDELMRHYRIENDYSYRMRGHPDHAEAMAAFLEKRSAKWSW